MWVTEANDQDPERVRRSFDSIVQSILTASLVSVSDAGPWTFTAYLASSGNRFWFTSQESTRHVSDLRANPATAIAIWRAPARWGDKLLGLQLSGRAAEVVSDEGAEAGLAALHGKYPGTRETLPDASAVLGGTRKTTMWMVECRSGCIRDEENLGKGRFPIVWSAD